MDIWEKEEEEEREEKKEGQGGTGEGKRKREREFRLKIYWDFFFVWSLTVIFVIQTFLRSLISSRFQLFRPCYSSENCLSLLNRVVVTPTPVQPSVEVPRGGINMRLRLKTSLASSMFVVLVFVVFSGTLAYGCPTGCACFVTDQVIIFDFFN